MGADIHYGQEQVAPLKGPNTDERDQSSPNQSHPACNTRPVHTEVPNAVLASWEQIDVASTKLPAGSKGFLTVVLMRPVKGGLHMSDRSKLYFNVEKTGNATPNFPAGNFVSPPPL